MNMKNEIANLQKLQNEKKQEIEMIEKLTAVYPDLGKHVGRWGKKAYFSAMVNDKVTHYDLRHNCGCCQDSPLELWPYLETPDGPVYSSPPMFRIGERCYMGGDIPNSGWKEELRKNRIPESMIEQIKFFFQKEQENRQDMVDYLGEERSDPEENEP